MREILFRGKCGNGKWEKGDLITKTPGSPLIMNEQGAWAIDPDTVGEYTGRKVKTGEVFEGDIGKSIDGLFLVAWDEEKAAFVMHLYDYPKETLYLEEMWDDAEIIGNIHDNAELLE